MKFYPRRRRSAPSIIIISLIDVLIVMITFLLFSTTYRNQPSVKLALPELGGQPQAGAGNEKPPLIVTIAKSDPPYYLGDRAISEDKLGQELRSAAQGDPALNLILSADREASWEKVARALQLARTAQIRSVKAFTKGVPAAGGDGGIR
jgi:biopolymer transport protein ExbD